MTVPSSVEALMPLNTEARQVITKGNRAVIVAQQGSIYSTRLYVNARDGISNADATLISNQFKSLKGALRWADAQVSA